MKVADRVEQLPPYPFASLARRIRELNAEGKDVIRLDMGAPISRQRISHLRRCTVLPGMCHIMGIPVFLGRQSCARLWRPTMGAASELIWILTER